MSADKLPSMAGRKALLAIARHGIRQMSANDAHLGTMLSLRNRGLIDHQDQLTDAGKAMVERLTVSPEVRHVA